MALWHLEMRNRVDRLVAIIGTLNHNIKANDIRTKMFGRKHSSEDEEELDKEIAEEIKNASLLDDTLNKVEK